MATESGAKKRRYPHPQSILCYSRITHEVLEDGTVTGSMPVLADHLDASGRMRIGALAPLVDSCAGVLAARAVHPDWCATLDFKLHLSEPPRSGHVHGVAVPLRVGNTTVLSENRLHDDEGRLVGVAHITFSRLPTRDGGPTSRPPKAGTINYTHAEEEQRLPVDEYYNLQFDPTTSAFELDHHDRIYNSFGSIQGGAMGALLERAAELCGERTFATGTHVTDLHFSYLAPATTGPFRVIATPIRIGATTVLAQVELIDLGRDNRRCAVGTAQAAVATESTVQETMY